MGSKYTKIVIVNSPQTVNGSGSAVALKIEHIGVFDRRPHDPLLTTPGDYL